MSRWKVYRSISSNFSKLFPQVPLSLNILSQEQLNQVQDVSHKVTLRRPKSITKAMDG